MELGFVKTVQPNRFSKLIISITIFSNSIDALTALFFTDYLTESTFRLTFR